MMNKDVRAKIVLLNAPLKISVDDRHFPPLGIGSMAASLRAKGYVCDIIDGDLPENQSVEAIVERLLTYDLIGISATTPSLQNAVWIAEMVKKVRDIPIVLGGHCATFMHQEIVERYTCFDVIVRGEGESAIIALCKDYFANGMFAKAHDYITAKNINGRPHLAKTIAIEEDLDSLPFPIRDGFGQYFDNNEIITISSSRGCPYGCSFCSATNFRSKWGFRSPQNIADEVYEIFLKKKDFKIIFVDDNFYVNPVRSIEILKKIQEKCGRKFEFVFATRADQIVNNGVEYLEELKQYGCIEIEMGIENGSTSALKRYNKNISPEQNKQAIQMLLALQIRPAVDYVLFDPETTRDELSENVNFLKSAKLWGYDPPLIYERIVTFPGTEFTKRHPQLYREDCIIASNIYFQDKQVLEIYKCMQQFRLRYQNKINLLIMQMRSANFCESYAHSYTSELLWLKLLPYRLLEKLVETSKDYRTVYEAFLLGNEVSSRLQKYELKYLH